MTINALPLGDQAGPKADIKGVRRELPIAVMQAGVSTRSLHSRKPPLCSCGSAAAKQPPRAVSQIITSLGSGSAVHPERYIRPQSLRPRGALHYTPGAGGTFKRCSRLLAPSNS
jgi:hypothetical protein